MPVFSYLRRDHHRRSNSSSGPNSPLPPPSSSSGSLALTISISGLPPKLPDLPSTPTLADTIIEAAALSDSYSLAPWTEHPRIRDPERREENPAHPSSPLVNFRPPSPTTDVLSRPRSSPEESKKEPLITVRPNHSQVSIAWPRPDHPETNSPKPLSPRRWAFAKGILAHQHPDDQKGAPAQEGGGGGGGGGGMGGSNLRRRMSVEDVTKDGSHHTHHENHSSLDLGTTPVKEPNKLDHAPPRRDGHHQEIPGEHIPSRSGGKTMLHLLNPMSLLARRRSPSAISPRQEDVSIGVPSLVPAIPDDYDPRIRGSIVHDFSLPRQRHHLSATPTFNLRSRFGHGQRTHGEESSRRTAKRRSERTPVFKEHFDDQKIENKGFLQSSSDWSRSGLEHLNIPAFAKNRLKLSGRKYQEQPQQKPYEPHEPQEHEKGQAWEREQEQEQEPGHEREQGREQGQEHEPEQEPEQEQEKEQEQEEHQHRLLVVEPADSSTVLTTNNSPPRPAQPRIWADLAQQPSALPSRLKSDASSRFSFDMSGIGSSVQEKLLEEKHKEKEAARKGKTQFDRTDLLEFEDDEIDYDAMLIDDDGLEERIPGVNIDADDEDGFGGFSGSGCAPLFVPILPAIVASPVSPVDSNLLTLPSPPVEDADAHGIENGVVDERDSLSDYEDSLEEFEDDLISPDDFEAEDSTLPTDAVLVPSDNERATKGDASPSLDDDDLYVDDGHVVELPADAVGESFDESIFDDDANPHFEHPFYSGTNIPMMMDETVGLLGQHLPDGTARSDEPSRQLPPDLRHVPSLASECPTDVLEAPSSLAPRFPTMEAPKPQSGVLTQHNLEAFHNALEAAANERLRRSMSTSEQSMGAQTVDSHPGLTSDGSRMSQTVETMGFDNALDEFKYDDDVLDDDPIIAEANAEALENDDDGFYGREFGFYAHASGNCNAQPFHGGFFGQRGVEGIHRSHSGRVNFREPSLTPITERSEWSTRNSIISLTTHGPAPANPSLSNPGLAQLIDMGSIDDEMSALMKHRRDAWGGSDGSLRSSASPSPQPQLSSPQQFQSPIPSNSRGGFPGIHEACTGPLSVDSPVCLSDSMGMANLANGTTASPDEESAPSSPTLTFNPHHASRGLHGLGDPETRTPAKTGVAVSHSRTSSSASVSYVMEMDEDGSSKWVLERRRTSGSGEVEVYEREVLTEGRI